MIDWTIEDYAQALEAGDITARQLVSEALERAEDPTGEGARVFTILYKEEALASADAIDLLRRHGRAPSRYAGIPVSVKDLFDVAGSVTTAGSVVLDKNPVATDNAVIVERLLKAGFILIGRSNMTEFAYSGLGLNPHYGTPANPVNRQGRHIPGGSSSGAAISVTDRMALGGIGTDTGGSCRIPAALCGIVGYKPSADRVDQEGCYPLSFSQDSIGSLAPSVRSAQILDAILAGEDVPELHVQSLAGARFAIPDCYAMTGISDLVQKDFDRALAALAVHGAIIDHVDFTEANDLPPRLGAGGLVAAEAEAHHQDLMKDQGDAYDPRVLVRIQKGAAQSAADYIRLQEFREQLVAVAEQKFGDYDAILLPTTPVTAPTIAALDQDEEAYGITNLLMLRNPTLFNFLDGCSISLPMHQSGAMPGGLMVSGLNGRDQAIFAIAHSIAPVIRP